MHSTCILPQGLKDNSKDQAFLYINKKRSLTSVGERNKNFYERTLSRSMTHKDRICFNRTSFSALCNFATLVSLRNMTSISLILLATSSRRFTCKTVVKDNALEECCLLNLSFFLRNQVSLKIYLHFTCFKQSGKIS